MRTKLTILDTTLRDGCYAVDHQYEPSEMAAIAQALDATGVDTIEVGFGEGLGGSSMHFGFSLASDEEYLQAVSGTVTKARLGSCLLPGVGTKPDIEMARKYGAKVFRVSTHVTESDIGQQHIGLAKKIGMQVIGAMMCCHMVGPDVLARQARLLASYGADVVYIQDSAGAMLPKDVAAAVRAIRKVVDIPIGIHAHNNLGCGVANVLAAVDEGATWVDVSIRGLGGGAGNAQSEVTLAVLEKEGYETGVDLLKIMAIADELVEPLMRRPQTINSTTALLGYAGVVGSMLRPILVAAERFGVDPKEVILGLGERKVVAGQDDVAIQVAAQLAERKRTGCQTCDG